MKLLIEDTESETYENISKGPSHIVDCKHCGEPINLKKSKRLPKKLIIERHGLCWAGLEQVYLIIYKLKCTNPKCLKKYTHKVFKSHYLYK